MNTISSQQLLNAKTSAPSRDAVKANEVDAKGKASEVQKAEVRQAEQSQKALQAEQSAKQKGEAKEGSVEQAVAKLNDYVQNTERKLEFQLDDVSGEVVVKVFDKHSDELIRQIPNEEALELAKKLNHEEPLMLFSAQV